MSAADMAVLRRLRRLKRSTPGGTGGTECQCVHGRSRSSIRLSRCSQPLGEGGRRLRPLLFQKESVATVAKAKVLSDLRLLMLRAVCCGLCAVGCLSCAVCPALG